MTKKTRKKSNLIKFINIFIIIGIALLIIVPVILGAKNIYENGGGVTGLLSTLEDNNELAEEQENVKKENDDILFRINDKYINKYGYINETNTSPSSNIIILQGINLKSNQEQIDESVFVDVFTLYTTLENKQLLNKANKIDVSDFEDVKIYMDSENKTISIGNTENLNTKLMYAEKIMQQEQDKSGTIFVKDISKVYFSESME